MTTTEKTEQLITQYTRTLFDESIYHEFEGDLNRIIRHAFISGMQAGLERAEEIRKEIRSSL